MADFNAAGTATTTLPNSILVQSGVFGSAPIEGTIGSFLATVFAASGLNSSGLINTPSMVAQSGVDVSALAKFGGSIVASGDVNASAIAARGTLSANASVVVVSGLNTSAAVVLGTTASILGSLVTQSGLATSGLITFKDGSQQSVAAAGAAGASGNFPSGVTTSAMLVISPASTFASAGTAYISVGVATGLQGSFIIYVSAGNTFLFAVNTAGLMSLAGSGAFQSGLNTSALAAIGGTLSAAGINASTYTGASGVFASGANLSAALQGTTASFTNLAASQVTGASGLFQSGIVDSAVLAIAPPSTFASVGTAYISVYVATGAQGSYIFFASVANTAITLITTSGMLQTQGLSIIASVAIGGLLSVNASAAFQSGLNTSGAVVLGTTQSILGSLVAQSGLATSGLITFKDGSQQSVAAGAVGSTFSSGGTFSAQIAVTPGSAFASAGGLAYLSIGPPTGAQASYLINVSIGNVVEFRVDEAGSMALAGGLSANVSGIFSSGVNLSATIQGTTASFTNVAASQVSGASGLFQSGVNLSATIQGTTASFTNIAGSQITGASGLFQSGVLDSAIIGISPASTTASAGGAYISIGVPTGAQVSFIIITSIGNVLVLRVDEAGSMALAGGLSTNASGIFASGLNISGLVAVGGNVSATNVNVSQINAASGLFACILTTSDTLSIGGSVLGQSGATFSGLVSATSFVGAFTLVSADAPSGGTLSALLSVGASALFQSGVLTSGIEALAPPSTAASAGGLAYLSIGAPTGAQASYLINASIGNVLEFRVDEAGSQVLAGGLSTGTSGVFTSGLTASGQVALTSVIAQSGVNVSATTTEVSVLVACTLTASGLLSIGGSTIITSGLNLSAAGLITTLSATNINASTFNGAPLTTGTSATYPSGLTTCALTSIGASAIFSSGINTSGPNLGVQPSIQAIIQSPSSGLAGSTLASLAFSTLTGKVAIVANFGYTTVASAQIDVDGIFAGGNQTTGPSGALPLFIVASGLTKSNHLAKFTMTSGATGVLSNAIIFDVQ